MKTLLKLFTSDLKILARNRQALFWSLAFPLMFTIIFGFFFGNENNKVGTVALINNSQTEISKNLVKAVKDSEIFTVQEDKSEQDARDLLQKGKIVAVIGVPKEFGEVEKTTNVLGPNGSLITIPKYKSAQLEVIYDPANAQINSIITSFFSHFTSQLNLTIRNAQEIYTVKQVAITDKVFTYFDFVLAGLFGLALMNSSIIGIAVGMSRYREDQILKRITTTPLKTWKFIVAEVASRLVINVIQISLIILVGVRLFHAHIYGSYLLLYALALLGGLLFQMIGFAIASLVKTTDAAQGMATAITVPMMFLAGVFFPTDQLPKWLSSIVQYLPLAPLLRMIRTAIFEANSVLSEPKNIIIVISWILFCFIVSVFKFRLTEE